MNRLLALALVVCALGCPALFSATEMWPGASYDPKIPTFQKVLGYGPGDRIASHAEIVRYFEGLAAASPRLKIFDYATSWQKRRLIYAAIGSEANIQRLEQVRAGMKRLADPRTTPEAEARKLISSLPAVVWLGYAVHGNEISSPDAAMFAAYHLLAARNDAVVNEILDNTVVLIDPLQNPDGRDRFWHHYQTTEGLEPDANQISAEHIEPWPGGRTNHYHFDMNRDWFAITQPETAGRIQVLQQWYPLVFVDMHEMGSDTTYYFAPEADPYNPHLVKAQRDHLHWFGQNNARYFDKFGFDYFTREIFDAFYPGYGASWPAYYGALAMTYENASTRGLKVRKSDGTVLSFAESVQRHFLTSIATSETAARNREKLLAEFWNYRKTAIEEGKSESIRVYVLPRRGDVSAVDKLAALLAEQGIEVRQAPAAFRSAQQDFPAGSYVISLAQPNKRMARVLLDADVKMDEKFLREQERRRKKRLPDQIYDVTAWSLPGLFSVECVALQETVAGEMPLVKPARIPPGKVNGGRADVAYLVPWGSQAAGRFLAAALRSDFTVLSSDKSFRQGERTYPAGTLILKVKDNKPLIHDAVARLAQLTGAEIHATSTSWVEDGVNFGSNYVVKMRRPNIAMAWDVPTAAYAAGATRFVLERQFQYPVTLIRTTYLSSADLNRFHVLILPDVGRGSYAQQLGPGGIRNIKEWVAAGGTLIAIGDSIDFLASKNVSLLDTEREASSASQAPKKKDETEGRKPGKTIETEEAYLKEIQAESELPAGVAGVLAKVRLDEDHWLTAGAPRALNVLVNGRSIYTPLKLDKGVNAGTYLGPGELLAGGYLWEENRKQLAYKPFLMTQRQGRGNVIGFTADPNFRAYMDGLNVLFLNAIFRGPAHSARPVGQAGGEFEH
jgi:hypothetical protein